MSDIRSEEQQQLEAIKNWFQKNALALVAAIVLFCAIFFGPGLYQSYKDSQVWPVSDTFAQFSEAVVRASSGPVATSDELHQVDQLADMLVEQYPDSHYAYLASLSAAGLSANQGSFAAARDRLQWAVDHASTEEDAMLANYRLARVEVELGELESARERLQGDNEHFAALYAETRGDIHVSLGEREQAIAEYELALDKVLADNNAQRNRIDLKLDNLKTGLGALPQ